MANGSNDWGVSFSRVTFLKRALEQHDNVLRVSRDRDILFTVVRDHPADTLNILCADEYTFGLGMVHRALAEFQPLHIISVGGNWNGYTPEAKDYCLRSNLGLYNSVEIAGGLWKPDFWAYHQRDDKGTPIYQYKAAG